MINMNTKNKSFKDMRNLLYDKGVENTDFMLELKDETLLDMPEDPTKWDKDLRKKINRECKNNFWFFVREIVRIPTPENLKYSDPYEYCPRFNLRHDSLRLFYAYTNGMDIIYRINNSESLANAIAILMIYEYSIKQETSYFNYDMKIPNNIETAVNNIHKLNTYSQFINSSMINKVVRDARDIGYEKFIFDIFDYYTHDNPKDRYSALSKVISLDPIYDGTYSDNYIADGFRKNIGKMTKLRPDVYDEIGVFDRNYPDSTIYVSSSDETI